MNRYKTSTPRVALGFAAAAMTALTLAVAVVVPATMLPSGVDSAVVLAGKSQSPAPASIVRPAQG